MTTATKQRAKSVGNHEPIINDAPKMLEAFDVGCVAHQGDLIIVGIKSLPKTRKSRPTQQLAEGNTQGSRHILRDGIKVYDCDREQVVAAIKAATGVEVQARYVGPVFVSPKSPTENDLSHPEHGNHGYPAGQVCAVVYQRNLDSEQREQITRD